MNNEIKDNKSQSAKSSPFGGVRGGLKKLDPFKGVIYFVIVLFASDFVWKLAIAGDESDVLVTFLGMDVTAFFSVMTSHFSNAIFNVLNFFGSDVMQRNNVLFFENGNAVRIIWGCTGIKQTYIYICIIAFARGPWMKKLWYIPAGLAVVYLFNLFRMAVIVELFRDFPHWFDFLHEFLFKYGFYGVIFLMWLFWDEVIRKPQIKSELARIKNGFKRVFSRKR